MSRPYQYKQSCYVFATFRDLLELDVTESVPVRMGLLVTPEMGPVSALQGLKGSTVRTVVNQVIRILLSLFLTY